MDTSTAKYGHMLRAVYERPWAIAEMGLRELVASLEAAAAGLITREELALRAARPNASRSAAVAVIPVRGVISQGQGLLGLLLGGTSVDQLADDFKTAMADRQVDGVVLDIDSPGGTVNGVAELASLIRSNRGRKPIVAVASGQAESAAYWIASAADEIVVTPSGSVGSIGVYTLHHDFSAAAAMEGVKTTVISYGKNKAEGNRFEPLSEHGRAQLQARVDYLGQMFDRAVAAGRKVSVEQVRRDFGQGDSFNPNDAVRLGLADREESLGDAITRVGRGLLAPVQAVALTSPPAIGHSESPVDDGADLQSPSVEQQTEPQAATPMNAWRNHAKVQLALAQLDI